jgi:hypothetical protein
MLNYGYVVSLTRKYFSSTLKIHPTDKHVSLFCHSCRDEEKQFYEIDTRLLGLLLLRGRGSSGIVPAARILLTTRITRISRWTRSRSSIRTRRVT